MNVVRAGVVNSAFSFTGSVASLLLVPFFLRVYGLEVYGALTLLTALAQYFAVLDLGFSNALVRYYHRTADGDSTYYRLRRTIVGFFLGAGVIAITAATVTAHHWASWIHLTTIVNLQLAVLGAGGHTILLLIGNSYNTSLVARLRYGHLNTFNLTRNLGPQIVAAATYASIPDLGIALFAAFGFSCIVLSIHLLILRRTEPSIPPSPDAPQAPFTLFLKESAGFSLQALLNALTFPVLQTVVGARFGLEANGLVDISRRILFAFRRFIAAAFVPLFAKANHLIATHQWSAVRPILVRGTALSIASSFAFYLVLHVSLPVLLSSWIGDAAPRVQPIAEDLLAAVAFTLPHVAAYHIIETVHRGRLMNAVGSATWIAVTSLAFLPAATTVSDALLFFRIGAIAAAIITLSAAAAFYHRLRQSAAWTTVTSPI